MTTRFELEQNLKVERRLSLLFAVGACIVILDQTIFKLDELALWSSWWNVGAGLIVAGFFTLALGSLHLPSTVLKPIWLLVPLLYAALQFFWVFAALDPAEIQSPPWILTLAPPVVTLLVLVARPIAVVFVSLLIFLLPAISSLLFLGQIPPVVLRETPIQLTNVVYVVIFLGIYAQLKRLRLQEKELRDQQLWQARAAAMAGEHVRVSRIVHDEVLSALAAAIQTEGAPPMVLKRATSSALTALDQSIDTASPSQLQSQSIPLAFDELISALRAIDEGFVLNADLGAGRIQADALNAATLAAAEALRNSKRHAGDWAVRKVDVQLRENSVRISVSDNGVGFDTARAYDGLGIPQSVRQRMREVGGAATISSDPGHGTEVIVSWQI